MESAAALPSHVLTHPGPTEDDISLYRRYSADVAAGVAVVSTLLRGRDYAATVSGFLSVSYDPPTMLVSLYAESRIAEAVAASGTWALSVLGSRHRSTADWLASPGTPVEGLLAQIPCRRGTETGAAVVDGALAYFELSSTAVHAAATHILVVGEVLSMGSLATGAEGMDPLVHFGAAYHRLQS
ncbi:flavin reductase family protein [Arthrobacter sp. H14-L1]|uniref:flavin reductase family protein n=1 Tax=Arthrobacter sp. H14-L1 TaxID=2996697 RepID=UPI00226F6D50|nr:flavin reductase family protein [Arthrobacter sp. H14-L1]MCY0905126.1 flavin reductase family protein [Arthrobacter sp. H14-L1]